MVYESVAHEAWHVDRSGSENSKLDTVIFWVI